jgi:hypothetical protein
MRQKKSSSAMSQRSSSAKKLQELAPSGTIPEEDVASTKSLLSKKDYEEIRSIVRQTSQKDALSSKKSESAISVKGESTIT